MTRSVQIPRPTKQEVALLPPYQQLPLNCIVEVKNEAQARIVLEELKAARFVGFDTESKPTLSAGAKSDGPHIVQFATEHRAFIFPIGPTTPLSVLKAAIESHDIVKVGFGFKSDRSPLMRKLGIKLGATVDLSNQMRKLGYRQAVGIKAAVAIALQRRLQKSKSVTTSNWALPKLQTRQLQYAADDAHAALMVFNALGMPYTP